MTWTPLDDARRAVLHRIANHRAGLKAAADMNLPNPEAIYRAEVRLQEAIAVLYAIDHATGRKTT